MRQAVALLLLAAAAGAEEHASLNFAIDWPAGEGWGEPEDWPGPGAALSRGVADTLGGRALHVVVMEAPGATFDGDEYEQGLLKGMAKDLPGARVTSERRHEFLGAPALTLRIAADLDEQPLVLIHLAMAAEGRLYSITATSTGGDGAWADEAFGGFRFLRPPASGKGAAERIGQAVGRYLVGPLLLVGLVYGIVLLVRRLTGRRGARASG